MEQDHRQPTILLIEPKRQALGLMVRRLNEAGYPVLPALTTADGIALLYRSKIDLVLAELRLPRTSGAELAKMIRDDSPIADMPIMFITGRSDREGAIEAYQAGADDVIAKPFDTDVLIARIGRRLARAKSVAELKRDNAVLDARIIERSIELGEMRERLQLTPPTSESDAA